MQLSSDGAQLYPAAFGRPEIASLSALLSLAQDRPGARLSSTPGLSGLIAAADSIAAAVLGRGVRAVGAKIFDKSPERNWSLGWHQDRTIPVRERREIPDFGQWTIKAGIPHCFPPFEILERSLVLRIHLDPASEANAPLLVAPGSHRLGAVPESEIPGAVERLGVHACLAEAGDIWAYAAPILHASDRAGAPTRRRVLQLLYSADTLPGGLEWPQP